MNKIISIIVLALVLAAPATYAQQTTIEPVLRAGYELDDNATLSILTIDEPDISGTLLDASVRFGYRSPTTTFSATPRVLDRNYGEEEFDSTDEFFIMRFDRRWQSSQFLFRGRYAKELARTAERVDTDFDIEDPADIPDDSTGLVQVLGDRERIEVVPTYTYNISDASTMGVDVRYTDVTYERQLATLLNDFANVRANLNFSRDWSPRTTALFGLTYRTYQADGSPSVSGYGVNGGIERLLSEKTTLRVVVGLENTEIIGGSSKIDPVGEITLIRRLETIKLLAQYRRVVSGGGSGNLTVRDVININFTRDLNERVSAGIGVRAYATKSQQEGLGTLDERDYVQLRAAVVWHLSRSFSLEANYRYTVLDRVNIGEAANSNNITFWVNWRPSGYSSAH
jgi:hypothetical protein